MTPACTRAPLLTVTSAAVRCASHAPSSSTAAPESTATSSSAAQVIIHGACGAEARASATHFSWSIEAILVYVGAWQLGRGQSMTLLCKRRTRVSANCGHSPTAAVNGVPLAATLVNPARDHMTSAGGAPSLRTLLHRISRTWDVTVCPDTSMSPVTASAADVAATRRSFDACAPAVFHSDKIPNKGSTRISAISVLTFGSAPTTSAAAKEASRRRSTPLPWSAVATRCARFESANSRCLCSVASGTGCRTRRLSPASKRVAKDAASCFPKGSESCALAEPEQGASVRGSRVERLYHDSSRVVSRKVVAEPSQAAPTRQPTRSSTSPTTRALWVTAV
mmetsp:Transcript_24379/g.64122  ORF Transcript_24379/g.64122 Transcript_24379/m.64122 type:complete len:337 (+) Transcript_24379:454-1464(+)